MKSLADPSIFTITELLRLSRTGMPLFLKRNGSPKSSEITLTHKMLE